VGIVRLLMSLDNPARKSCKPSKGGRLFEGVKLKGIRVETRKDPKSPKGTNPWL